MNFIYFVAKLSADEDREYSSFMLYTHGQVFVSAKFQRHVFTIIDSGLIQGQQLYLLSHG